jgi:hypothetical protein
MMVAARRSTGAAPEAGSVRAAVDWRCAGLGSVRAASTRAAHAQATAGAAVARDRAPPWSVPRCGNGAPAAHAWPRTGPDRARRRTGIIAGVLAPGPGRTGIVVGPIAPRPVTHAHRPAPLRVWSVTRLYRPAAGRLAAPEVPERLMGRPMTLATRSTRRDPPCRGGIDHGSAFLTPLDGIAADRCTSRTRVAARAAVQAASARRSRRNRADQATARVPVDRHLRRGLHAGTRAAIRRRTARRATRRR